MTAQLHIQGTHDQPTATKIRETLELTAGVFKAEVTPNAKTVNVAFDERIVQVKTLIKKIQDLGLQATIGDEQKKGDRHMSEGTGTKLDNKQDPVDDRGTNQTEGRALLKKLRDQGFDSSDQELAVALGRPVEEVEAWTGGAAPVDDDVIMKARGIANQRGIEIE